MTYVKRHPTTGQHVDIKVACDLNLAAHQRGWSCLPPEGPAAPLSVRGKLTPAGESSCPKLVLPTTGVAETGGAPTV